MAGIIDADYTYLDRAKPLVQKYLENLGFDFKIARTVKEGNMGIFKQGDTYLFSLDFGFDSGFSYMPTANLPVAVLTQNGLLYFLIEPKTVDLKKAANQNPELGGSKFSRK